MATYRLKGKQLEDFIRRNPNVNVKVLSAPKEFNIENLRTEGARALEEQESSSRGSVENFLANIGKSVSALPRAFGGKQSLTPTEQLRFKADPDAFRIQSAAQTASFLPIIANPIIGGAIGGGLQSFGQQDLRGGLDVGNIVSGAALGGALGAGGKLIGKGISKLRGTQREIAQAPKTITSKFDFENPSTQTAQDLKGIVNKARSTSNIPEVKGVAQKGSPVGKQAILRRTGRDIGIKAREGPGAVARLDEDLNIIRDATKYHKQPFSYEGAVNTDRLIQPVKENIVAQSGKVFDVNIGKSIPKTSLSRIANNATNKPAGILTEGNVATRLAERIKNLLPESSGITILPKQQLKLPGADLEVLKKSATPGYMRATKYIEPSMGFDDLLDEQIYNIAKQQLDTIPGYSAANRIQEAIVKNADGMRGVYNAAEDITPGYGAFGTVVRNVTKPITRAATRGALNVAERGLPSLARPQLQAGLGTSLPVAGIMAGSGPQRMDIQPSITEDIAPQETITPETQQVDPVAILKYALQVTGGNFSQALQLAKYIQDSQGGGLSATQQQNAAKVTAAERSINSLKSLYDRLPSSDIGRLGGGVASVTGTLGLNPAAKAYSDLRTSVRSQVARALGEVGNLSESEQSAVLDTIPSVYDTKEEADTKWNYIFGILGQTKSAFTGS